MNQGITLGLSLVQRHKDDNGNLYDSPIQDIALTFSDLNHKATYKLDKEMAQTIKEYINRIMGE